jgi:hypothetical protein
MQETSTVPIDKACFILTQYHKLFYTSNGIESPDKYFFEGKKFKSIPLLVHAQMFFKYLVWLVKENNKCKICACFLGPLKK